MSQFLHTGFAAGLEALNHTPTQDDMVILPGIGRAYARDNALGYYAASIHSNAVSVDSEPHTELLRALEKKNGFGRGSIYMGCAGFLNLSYIAATRPAGAVLFDINPLQTLFWKRVIGGLAQSRSFHSFRKYMQNLGPLLEGDVIKGCGSVALSSQAIVPVPTQALTRGPRVFGLFRECAVTDSFEWWAANTPEWRWCGTDYQYLHHMAASSALGALTLDLKDDAAWVQLGDHLRDCERHVQFMYESNTRHFIASGRDWSGQHCDGDALTKLAHNFGRAARGEELFVIDDKGCAPLRERLSLTLT